MSSGYQILKRFRFGLEAKFVVLATAVILVMGVIGSRLILAYGEKLLFERSRSEAVVLAESMALSFLHTLIYEELGLVEESGLLDLFIEEIVARPDMAVRSVEVLNPAGRVIAHSDYRQFGRVDSELLQRYGADLKKTRTLQRKLAGEAVLEAATPLRIASRFWGTLVLVVSLRPVEAELSAFASRLTLLTAVAIGVSVLVAFLVAGALARPIKRLAAAISQVGPELKTRLEVDRADEIGLLQSSFLEMLERLHAARREQEQIRDAMVRAEKLASVGSLASGVAHEINNPLGGMKNCLVQMEAHPEDRERTQLYIGLMRRAVDRITQVIRGLLDFSRHRELQLAPLSLSEVVQTTLPLVTYRLEKNGIELEVDLAPDLPAIMGDHYQLEQVLVNLVLNAVDALEEGGRLRIHGHHQDGSVRVQIQDTGPGIPKELQGRIFDPFFTTKEVGKGTGLGLAVALNIVHEHGGDLFFSNGPEGGAVFTIVLPLAPASAQTEEKHTL